MTAVLQPLAPADAVAALARRGENLSPSFAWQDVWQDVHQRKFTVAKSAGFDILNDIFDAVQAALNEGRTLRDFASDLQPVLERKGWWGRGPALDPSTGGMVDAQLGSMRRLKTIFDVNMRVSYAQGAWASFERNKASRPWLRYVAVMDGRARPEHAARHNLCLPVDHPYWNIWAPPCGWNCRCTLQQLSNRDIERLSAQGEMLQFEPPKDEMVAWGNTRTGDVEMVPKGIDPGWAYNPGKIVDEAGEAAIKLIDAPPALAEAGMASINPPALEEQFAAWVEAIAKKVPVIRRSYVVGIIDRHVMQRLGDDAPASAAIIVDQGLVSHALRSVKAEAGKAPEIDVLKALPIYLRNPAAILRDRKSGALIYVFRVDGRAGRIAIALGHRTKATTPGGKRQTVRANVIRTVDHVPVEALRNVGWYETLAGKI